MASAHSSSAPIIGLTTYLEQAQTGVWDVPASFLPKVYFEAVTRAGGIAVLLPPQPVDAEIADAVLDRLVHNAHKVSMKGPSRRKENAQAHS